MNKQKEKIKAFFWLLVLIGGFAGLLIYLQSTGIFTHMSSAESFRKYIEGYGEKAILVFFIAQFISVIVAPIPSNISTLVGGAMFGVWKSFFISILAVITGSIAVFILARKLGRPFTQYFVSPKISNKYEEYLASKKGETLLILMFLLPFFPDDAINFLVGLTKIKFIRYLTIMVLTRPWGLLVSSVLGGANFIMPWWGWCIIAVLAIVIVKNTNQIDIIITKSLGSVSREKNNKS